MRWTSQKKKKKNSLQKINEDTEQLDIWYTVYIYCPSAACGCAPPTYFIGKEDSLRERNSVDINPLQVLQPPIMT